MSKHNDLLVSIHNASQDPDSDPIAREFSDWLGWIYENRERKKRGHPLLPPNTTPAMDAAHGIESVPPGWTQCRTCGHLGYTTAPERPCALCDAIMQSDAATIAYIGYLMRTHNYDPHTAAEELRQLATKGQ